LPEKAGIKRGMNRPFFAFVTKQLITMSKLLKKVILNLNFTNSKDPSM
jgi:hypothetical protein